MQQEIITSAGIQGCFRFLPTLWTDLSAVNLNKNEQVLSAFLTAMCHYQAPQADTTTASAADQTSTTITAEEVTGLQMQLRRIIEHLILQMKEQIEEAAEGRNRNVSQRKM